MNVRRWREEKKRRQRRAIARDLPNSSLAAHVPDNDGGQIDIGEALDPMVRFGPFVAAVADEVENRLRENPPEWAQPPQPDPQKPVPYGSKPPNKAATRFWEAFAEAREATRAFAFQPRPGILRRALALPAKAVKFAAHWTMVLLPAILLVITLLGALTAPNWVGAVLEFGGWDVSVDRAIRTPGTAIFASALGSVFIYGLFHYMFRGIEGRWWWEKK